MSPTTFEQATEVLGSALLPLGDLLSDPALVTVTLGELGWQPPPGVDLAKLLGIDIGDLAEKLTAVLQSTAQERDDPVVMAPRYASLLISATRVLTKVDDVAAALPTALASAGDYATKTGIAGQLPRRLLDYLVFRQLALAPPAVPSLLQLVGLMRVVPYPRNDAIYQTRHDRLVVDWPRVGRLLTDPGAALAADYAWGTPAFQTSRLLPSVGGVLSAVGVKATAQDAKAGGGTGPLPTGKPDIRLRIERDVGAPTSALGVEARRVGAGDADADAGIEVVPAAGFGSWSMNLAPALILKLTSGVTADGGVSLQLRPSGVRLGTPSASVTGTLALGLHYGDPNGTKFEVLRGPGGLTIQVGEAFMEVGGEGDNVRPPDAWVRVGLRGCRLTIMPPAADAFLKQVMPSEFGGDFDAVLRWSRRLGVTFEGSGGLSLTVPVSKTIGPVSITALRVSVAAPTGDVMLRAGADGTVVLGPVEAVVQDVGLQGTLRARRGNLGPVDLDIGFKPPTGVGITIDAPPVTGVGYLACDPEAGQYLGAVQLQLGNLALSAVGLLSTRLPGGQPGFSLVVLISTRFPPIQLGFGFFLTGVGGLVAINRTVAVPELQRALRAGTLGTSLFPADMASNPTKVVADLQRFFPVATGQSVLGPTVEITWGADGLLTAQVGLFIEFPAPTRVLLAGTVRLTLPTPKQAIAEIGMDVLGTLDLSSKELAIDAELRNSRVAGFTLTGGAALRAAWGDRPDFLLAIGGFHPRFTPPSSFPALRRVTLSLSDADNPRIRLQAYLALTPNTVQVGASIDIYVAFELGPLGTFAVAAMLAFDALFQFDPFAFVVDIHACVLLTWNDAAFLVIRLDISLSGPSPWRAVGHATFECFVSHTINFQVTVGEPAPSIPPPTVSALATLVDELAKPSSWKADLPSAGRPVVVMSPRAVVAAGAPLLHPLGTLTVRQSVVPLELEISRLGSARVGRDRKLSITGTTLGPTSTRSPVYDQFAPAQFLDLSDEEKLSWPAFQPMVSGATLGAPGPTIPTSTRRVSAQFQTWILSRTGTAPVASPATKTTLAADRLTRQVALSTVAQEGGTNRGAQVYANTPLGAAVVSPTYAVATPRTLNPVPLPNDEQLTFLPNHAVAEERRRSLGDELVVVETFDAFAREEPPPLPPDLGEFVALSPTGGTS